MDSPFICILPVSPARCRSNVRSYDDKALLKMIHSIIVGTTY
uniref:Uncharacterized protein n=1 Tax=Arundo donax TaxID=35708 RepID=A0A0A9AGZ2_ARUDO